MTLYLVAWLTITPRLECPWWAKVAPGWVQGLACRRAEDREYGWAVTTYRAEAERQVRARGGDALLLELRGARARRKAIRQVLEIEP